MISGETMKKMFIVKQIDRYTNERKEMYRGRGIYEHKKDCISLYYEEQNKPCAISVEVNVFHDAMKLSRSGEIKSTLYFKQGEKTKGVLSSAYGDIEIELYTYTYIHKDNVIQLEYDVLHGDEVSGGYHITWNIKED